MANYVSLLLSHVRLARQTRKIENRLLDTRDSFDDIRQHALEAHSNLIDHLGEHYLPDPDIPTPEDIELILAVDHLRSARQKIERPWMKASLAWRAGDEPRQQLRGIGYPWRARNNKNIRQQWEKLLSLAEKSLHDTRRIIDGELSPGLISEVTQHQPSTAEAAAVVAAYRANNATFVAELEQLHYTAPETETPSEPRGMHGGLPFEIAQRVETTMLETGPLLATLRRYQEFGARYLIAQQRALLGDDMGLGKTIQVLAAMCHLYAKGARHFFVVVPNSVLLNWEREVTKHTELSVVIAHGDEREDRIAQWRDNGGVAITTYGTLQKILHLIPHVDMVAIDEAHLVKNPEAQRTQAVAQLTKGCDYVTLMTGTALENRLDEMLALAALAQPEMEHVFEQMSRMAIEYIHSEDLIDQVAPVYLRRTQKDVLFELPERILLDNWVIPSEDDKAAYLLSPAQVMSRRLAATRGDGSPASAKYEFLLDLVEEHRQAGRKIVVFSFFRDVINDVCNMLGGTPSITGDISSIERQKIIDSFASDPDQSVLVLQVDAGGVGINLQCAQVVILMEAQFKPSTEWQAIARVHRMGQSRQVIVHRLLAIGTIEERLVQLIEMKAKLFESYAHDSSVRNASSMATDTGPSIEAQLQNLLNDNPLA